jgi:hypothetical protein
LVQQRRFCKEKNQGGDRTCRENLEIALATSPG